MEAYSAIRAKVFEESDIENLVDQVAQWKKEGHRIVFTNGCFDILHRGHVDYLAKASLLGQKLIVGLNSDSSVKSLKGPSRPVQDETSRSWILASLIPIDAVIVFSDSTPLHLINSLKPNVLVKGGDYRLESVVGAPQVLSWSGSIVLLPYLEGHSTTSVLARSASKP